MDIFEVPYRGKDHVLLLQPPLSVDGGQVGQIQHNGNGLEGEVWGMGVVEVLAQGEKLLEEARGGRGEGYMADMAVLGGVQGAQTAQAV